MTVAKSLFKLGTDVATLAGSGYTVMAMRDIPITGQFYWTPVFLFIFIF